MHVSSRPFASPCEIAKRFKNISNAYSKQLNLDICMWSTDAKNINFLLKMKAKKIFI